MNTSEGTFAMTDGGVNVSTRISDHLRVGAQLYLSSIGKLGGWRPELDWAVADYRFNDTFGIRAGKVKTVLGLYTAVQDAGFVHTWALLPQSLYPVDLRDVSISHTGADIYGTLNAPGKLAKMGAFSYTLYTGVSSDSKHSGYYFNTQDGGVPTKSLDRTSVGADVRWNTPVSGLMAGSSFQRQTLKLDGTLATAGNLPYRIDARKGIETTAFYGDYMVGNLHLAGEFRHVQDNVSFDTPFSSTLADVSYQGWFASVAYRLGKRWEVGTYHSRFWVKAPSIPLPAANHIYDQVATVRFDVNKFWSVKVEGHFMDGYGDLYSAHGFYTGENPGGLKPTTNLVVIRSCWAL